MSDNVLSEVHTTSLFLAYEILLKKPKVNYLGICSNYLSYIKVYSVRLAVDRLMIKCIIEKGVYSGSLMHPIRTSRNKSAVLQYSNCQNKWDKRTAYGKARSEVLELMRDKVKQELLLRGVSV